MSSFSSKWYFRKSFIIPFTFCSVPLSYYFFDRYQCRLITQKYLNVAQMYGKVPLAPDQAALKITFVAQGRDREDLLNQHERFMNIAQPLLTAAGIEYAWLDGSKRKHAIEYVKCWNDRNSQLVDGSPEASKSITNVPMEDSSMVLFDDLTEWRMKNWLLKDIDTTLSSTSAILNSGRGYLGKIMSFITWPISFLYRSSSTLTDSKAVEDISADLEGKASPLLQGIASTSTTPPSPLDVSIAEQVKRDLLPKETNIYTYQQGLIGVGDEAFSQLIEGFRLAATQRVGIFEKIFLGRPTRLGLLPLSKSMDKSFVDRIWGFFNKREEVETCSKAIFGVISESLDMWNTDMNDKIWPTKHSSEPLANLAVPPYFGTLLYFKPVQVDMASPKATP